MKKLYIIVVIQFLLLSLSAQTTQKGRVLLQNSSGQPLAGVQISARGASPTLTNEDGSFQLTFNHASPGDLISMHEIYKKGYAIVNESILETWILSTNKEFTVIMCPEEQLQENREKFYRLGLSNYEQKYETTIQELELQRNANQLSAQDYETRISEANSELEAAVTNLEKYSNRLASVNLDEMDTSEKEAFSLLRQGKIDESIAFYEKRQLEKEIEQIIPSLQRYSDILQFAGGNKNLQKAGTILESISIASPNFSNQYIYAAYLKSHLSFNSAIEEMLSALNLAGNEIEKAKAMRELGELYMYMHEFENSESYQKQSMEIYERLAKDVSPSYYLNMAENMNYLGNLYYTRNEIDEGIKILEEGLSVIELSNDSVSYDYRYHKASLLGTLGASYMKHFLIHHSDTYKEKMLERLLESTILWEELALIRPNEINKILSSSYNNLYAIYYYVVQDKENAEKYLLMATRLQESVFDKYPDMAKRTLTIMYRNLGSFYRDTEQYDEALYYIQKALELDRELVELNPDAYSASLAGAYHITSTIFTNMGNTKEGVEYALKAMQIHENNITKDINTHLPYYANTCMILMQSYFFDKSYSNVFKSIRYMLPYLEDENIFNSMKETLMKPVNQALVYQLELKKTMPEYETLLDSEALDYLDWINQFIEKHK